MTFIDIGNETKKPKRLSEVVNEQEVEHIVDFILSQHERDFYYKYPIESMVRAFVWAKLKGFWSCEKIHKHLWENYKDVENLGFKCRKMMRITPLIPTARNFRHFKQKRITGEVNTAVNRLVSEIKKKIQREGIILDDELVVDKPSRKAGYRTRLKRKKEKMGAARKFIRKKIFPKLWLESKHNSIFKRNDFLDLLMYIGLTGSFAEDGSFCLNMENPDKKVPNGDTRLYHLKKLGNRKRIHDVYREVFDAINTVAKSNNLFNRPVDVAIDFTDELFYGNKNADYVVATKPQKGTNWCYRFASINIVENGKRLTLLAVPVGPFDFKDQVVDNLVEYALKWVKIRNLYMDRGFNAYSVMDLLIRKNINFLMPKTRDPKVKRIMKDVKTPAVIDYFTPKGHGGAARRIGLNLKLIFIEGEMGEKLAFITNMDVGVEGIEDFVYQYSKRWGIETSYRMKNVFKPRTTSKNYVIRLFYQLFSFMMMNLWVLANYLLQYAIYGNVKDFLEITAKAFIIVLLKQPPP